MASILACSLHPMDVRLLRQFIAAMQGGPIPDFKAEVARRAHRDILLNWSYKVAKAAAPLAAQVPPDKWLLFTRLRPFFITTESPEQAAYLAERFLTVETQDDVINLYREEVARLDADQADDIIDRALRDASPNLIAYSSADDISAHLRAYLLYQRRQLEALAAAAGSSTKAQLARAGRLLAWRTCNVLANMHPSWQTRATSLTNLASRPELGLVPLVADPRGMYAAITQHIPGLHEQIPYHLSDDNATGLCVSPPSVPAVLSEMEIWPSPIPSHPTLGMPSAVEIQALREALLYAQKHQNGLWEAAGLVNPEQGIFPLILADQGEADERLLPAPPEPAAVAPAPTPTAVSAAASAPASEPAPSALDEFERKWEDTTPVDEDAPVENEAVEPKTPWFKKMFQKK